MIKSFFMFSILLTNVIFSAASKENSCKIKMASSKMSVFRQDKLIFNEGLIDEERFGKNAYNSYIISADDQIDYFYILENKLSNKHTHDKIQISAISSDTSTLDVKASVSYENSEFTESFEMSAIEVIYNCHENKSGKVKLEMTVTSDQCDPFKIYWWKECKIHTPPPEINIGVTYLGTEIMKDGKFQDSVKINDPNQKFPISQTISTFDLFISYPKANENIVHMKEPTIVYNEQDLTTIFRGQMAKGGNLASSPQSISIIFACVPLSKSSTDIQITLHFDNNSFINLFFNKQCNTIQEIQEYFTFLYIIYWLLLLLIVGFLVALFFYYLKRNELSLMEFYEKIREFIKDKVDYYKRKRNNNYGENRGLINNKFVEDDDIDIKITSQASADKEKSNKLTAFEYGGI